MAEGSGRRPAIVVSACLLGVPCNHEGRGSRSAAVERLAVSSDAQLVPICPEVVGGLPVPRPAAEVQPDGRVVTAAGDDVTRAYSRGASAAVALARAVGASEAVLKGAVAVVRVPGGLRRVVLPAAGAGRGRDGCGTAGRRGAGAVGGRRGGGAAGRLK